MRGGPAREGGTRPGGGLGPQAQAALKRAYDLRAAHPADSASELERIAGIAAGRGMLGMACHLSIEAARSEHAAGKEDAAIAQVKVAIGYASQGRVQGKAAKRFAHLVAQLRENGHTAAADQIEAEVRSKLGSLPTAAAAPAPMNRNQRRNVPKACGTCGAPVDYDVEFNDDGTADCRYCGVNL
jgi:hypothetical protein